ncbi:MAG: hypothetical protein AVDCRST_MAG73-3823, partial [uncultured Thermomicrobiales bacterium]
EEPGWPRGRRRRIVGPRRPSRHRRHPARFVRVSLALLAGDSGPGAVPDHPV